jgi:hypothetical protein
MSGSNLLIGVGLLDKVLCASAALPDIVERSFERSDLLTLPVYAQVEFLGTQFPRFRG